MAKLSLNYPYHPFLSGAVVRAAWMRYKRSTGKRLKISVSGAENMLLF